MPLAADRFRCPGSRCPDFVREGCRRFVDLKAGVGPETPYADASLEGKRETAESQIYTMTWVCTYKWPLTL